MSRPGIPTNSTVFRQQGSQAAVQHYNVMLDRDPCLGSAVGNLRWPLRTLQLALAINLQQGERAIWPAPRGPPPLSSSAAHDGGSPLPPTKYMLGFGGLAPENDLHKKNVLRGGSPQKGHTRCSQKPTPAQKSPPNNARTTLASPKPSSQAPSPFRTKTVALPHVRASLYMSFLAAPPATGAHKNFIGGRYRAWAAGNSGSLLLCQTRLFFFDRMERKKR